MVTSDKYIKFVVAGLLLGILMSAMDNTIVATAMGTIVAELGGTDKFVWVTSAYMVAVMAGMPIFGKLSDMYGRKRFFIFGLFVFLIGSALCGTAESIVQLSIYRAVQGIGGGALMPIAFTIVFDVFPPEKRGKMTALLGAVFGISSVLGPLLGAYITEYIHWHWIFYINIPLGILALFFIIRFYKETAERSKQKIDWWGAITLVSAVVCIMFALELGGAQFAWSSWPIITLLSGFAIAFLIFLIVETKAAEPIISFWMFRKRLFATSQVLAFLYGATFIILTVYIPIFVIAVYGGTATNAGFVLMPMMLGSVVGSGFGGMLQTKTSFRNLMIVSIFSYTIGMLLLATLQPDTARGLLTVYMIIVGFGVGFSFSLLPTASIHNVEQQYRGSANSTNAFFRSLGMTLGVTIFGTIQNKSFTAKLTEAFPNSSAGGAGVGINFEDPREIFEPATRVQIPGDILNRIVEAMSSSITYIFALALIPIGLAIVVVFFMGKDRVIVTKEKKPPETQRKVSTVK